MIFSIKNINLIKSILYFFKSIYKLELKKLMQNYVIQSSLFLKFKIYFLEIKRNVIFWKEILFIDARHMYFKILYYNLHLFRFLYIIVYTIIIPYRLVENLYKYLWIKSKVYKNELIFS